ncbi:hypothetical protein [Cognatiyoonia sp. IB215182]|uniref:hypothetical protein n=1 Tax=Cognatiyoonia sp. IB215182 TaxID=3097353 RepID=UPI002A16C912|nr:hypothetical protein [Cognatiyoonia sp. IB215182]MDX8354146.1 hypothetical protein [Cognatiyoonia sp. IB215182]
MIRQITLSLMALATVAGCAATPTSPTVSESDVDRAMEEAARISLLPETSLAELPTGTVTYDGQIGADVSGDANGSILADMTMVVGFSTNDVDGSVTNINLINPDGSPDQLLEGTLDINGFESNGNLNAEARGEVTGVDVDGFEVDSFMSLDLDGEVRDDVINGDAVYGDVNGTARGDFDLDVDGVFFGTQR